MNNVKVEIITGTSKQGQRKGQKWEAVKVTIGEYSHMFFAKSAFELRYIKEQLGIEEQE